MLSYFKNYSIKITLRTWVLLLLIPLLVNAQSAGKVDGFSIARVKYQGGGDWYNDPTALPNLSNYIIQNTHVNIARQDINLDLTDSRLFSHPILFLTGHGNLLLSSDEIKTLRTYLLKGGFLYVDDDYGLDQSFRKVMQKVFPEKSLTELPYSHGIYHAHFKFPNGLPKIHEHDNKPPRGYGLFDNQGRLMVFYTFETNLSDGWADPQVHNDPPHKRIEALQMGTNIVIWAITN